MPGTNDPAADDLEKLGTDPGMDTQADPSSDATQQADPMLDVLKPSGHAKGQETPKPQTTDWQKRYQAMRPEFDKRSEKLKSLEQIVKDPRIAELAKTDPKIAQALAKAGIQLAAEEAAGEEGPDAEDAYWKSAEGRQELYEARMDLKMELRDFATEKLGRRLSEAEESQIRRVLGRAGALSVEEAWELTQAGKQARLQAEQKRLADAQKRSPQGSRPRPTPTGPGSTKIDLKKPVTEFSDAEKAEYIRNLMEQG